MTIFGTPGGTPLNTTPFQGTAPGNTVQNTIQVGGIPGVGFFPPGSNNASGDTIQAAVSRGQVPANAILNNEGVGTVDTYMCSTPPLDGGVQASAANGVPTGSAAGGGTAGIGGVGGANMNANVGAVGDVVMTNQTAPSAVTYVGGAQPSQFAG